MPKKVKTVLKEYEKQYQKDRRAFRKQMGLPTKKQSNHYTQYKTKSYSYKPSKSTAKYYDYKNFDVSKQNSNNGCYIATCVYGSYDCPQVWTLRRFRDYNLDKTWYGRAFIKCYYASSPTVVKIWGDKSWFRAFWKKKLDLWVSRLNAKGVEATAYKDKY